jgi:hypothetical protein
LLESDPVGPPILHIRRGCTRRFLPVWLHEARDGPTEIEKVGVGYVTVVNHLTRPDIPSIIKFSHVTYTYSYKPPKSSQTIPLSQIQTFQFLFDRNKPSKSLHIFSFIILSRHISLVKTSYRRSQNPHLQHPTIPIIPLAPEKQKMDQAVIEPRTQSYPTRYAITYKISHFTWWPLRNGCEPPHTTRYPLNYKILSCHINTFIQISQTLSNNSPVANPPSFNFSCTGFLSGSPQGILSQIHQTFNTIPKETFTTVYNQEVTQVDWITGREEEQDRAN